MSEPISVERLERALRMAALIVSRPEWEHHLPVFERIEQELDAARKREASLERARRLVEAARTAPDASRKDACE